MKLSSKLYLTAAVLAALHALNVWLDNRAAAELQTAARTQLAFRNAQADSAAEIARLLIELETAHAPSARSPGATAAAAEALGNAARGLPAETHAPLAATTAALRERTRNLAQHWPAPLRSGPERARFDGEIAAARVALLAYQKALHELRSADAARELDAAEAHRRRSLWLAGLTILTLLITAWIWQRHLVEPLRQMAADARRIRSGHRAGVRVHYDRSDELGSVAQAFNEALDTLQSTTYSHSELERLVAERSAQLHDREAQLQRVVEGSGQGFWDWNIATGTVRFSGQWAQMLGYGLDELEHSFATWERLLHPADRPAAVAAVQAHIEGTSPTYEVEHRMLTKDGQWRWVLTRGLIVERDARGRAVHLSGTHTDIHARKLAEETLRQREEQLRLVSDNFPEGALYQFVVGTDGVPRNTYVGDGFRRILGIDREEPISNWRWLERLVLPEDLPAMQSRHQEAIRRREPLQHELRARTTTGELKWLSFRSHPRDGESGTVIWDGVMIDITRLKQAEAEIAQQVDFYAALNATTVELLERRDKHDLLQAIVQRTAVLLDTPHVELAFLEGEELVTRAYAGTGAGVLGDRATRAQATLSWRAVDSREPALTDDYPSMEGAREVYCDRGTRSAAVFPILRGNECLGILGLVRFQRGAAFNLRDLQKGQLLAQIVSLVLHNSSIYEDAVRVAEARMQALRESESRLREAQRIAHIGHWEYSFAAGNRIERWSDETYRIFGLVPQSEAIDRARFDQLVHPDDLERVRIAIADAFARHAKLTLQYRVIRPDGSVREIEDSGEPKRDQSGKVVGMQGIIQDVTERSAVETSLRESEARFKRVVENIGDALMVDDEEGRIVFANDRFLEMFRLRQEDLHGRTIFDHVLPEAREAVRAMHASRLAGATAPALFEIEAVRADGTHFWVELRVTSVVENGRAIGSQAALRDITERRIVEQTLRLLSTGTAHLSGEAFFHYVVVRLASLLGMEMGLVATFLPGNPTRVQTVALSINGELQPGRELPLDDSVAGAIWRERVPVFATAVPKAFPRDAFLASLGATGCAAVPLTGNAGEVTGFVAVMSRQPLEQVIQLDSVLHLAAVRLAAEIARARNERQFLDLFDFAPDAIVMVHQSGRIVRINRRAEALFGYSRNDLVGQPFTVLVPTSEEETHRHLAEQFSRAPHSRAMGDHASDLTARRKDGSAFPAEISLGPVAGENGVLVAAAVRDITMQRQSESRLRQSQKMESLGTLAGGIAHDFNNILTGMFGFLELARLDLPAGHPSRQWLDNIAMAGSRAKSLVKQILTFSRQNEGERTPVDPAAVVGEALRLLRSTLPPMVRIQERLERDRVFVLADGTQLHQVMMNLCTNAWHAMPESGGTITVNVAPHTVTEQEAAQHPELPRGPGVRISVSDDGCGMPANILERIFDPFFTTKAAGRGTGLGLAVVHGVVRSHGGAILAHSTPGAGSTFEIYLPAIAKHAPPEPAVTAIARGDGQRLMLVDDEDAGRLAMAALLEHLGYTVEHFDHPQVALTRFCGEPNMYAAVLTDFAMPQIVGTEFAQKVRAVRPDVPVLLITGYVDPSHRAEMKQTGFNAVLRKPPTVEELAEAVRRCLQPPVGSSAAP